MTLDAWLTQFAAGAAQLPGWQVTEGRLRRMDPTTRLGCCPLLAQWTVEHPEQPCTNSHMLWMHRLWGDTLSHAAIDQLMDAADFTYFGWNYGALVALRARLLTACHLTEVSP